MNICPLGRCNGSGWVIVDSLNARMCVCMMAKKIKQSLGDLAGAPSIPSTVLYQPGGVDMPPLVDRTQDNLFILGKWFDVIRPNLKRALSCKLGDTNLKFRFLTISDERIKNVWVGNEQSSKSKLRSDTECANSLRELMGLDYDLVLIRLGFLVAPNRAAPAMLKEALMIRESLDKPTWLFHPPDMTFGPGCTAYDPEVQYYIDNRFEVLELGPKSYVEPNFGIEEVSLNDDLMPPVRERVPQQTCPEPAPMFSSTPSMDVNMGPFGPKKKKGGWR